MTNLLHQVEALELDAAQFGFAWENPQQIMAQILSECDEIKAHLQDSHALANARELQEEIGDLLHAAFSLCVFCKFNPEDTLQKTVDKFATRLAYVKQLAGQAGFHDVKGQSFDQLMSFWNQAKVLVRQAIGPKVITINHAFNLDERLQSSCFVLLDWPLSRVLLKNNANFPWLVLVPRHSNVTEITALSKSDRQQLMEEIHSASHVIQDMFKPDKINTGTLGNIVSQLHIHVVARFKHDPLWPHGIWQATAEEKPYADAKTICNDLTLRLSMIDFHS